MGQVEISTLFFPTVAYHQTTIVDYMFSLFPSNPTQMEKQIIIIGCWSAAAAAVARHPRLLYWEFWIWTQDENNEKKKGGNKAEENPQTATPTKQQKAQKSLLSLPLPRTVPFTYTHTHPPSTRWTFFFWSCSTIRLISSLVPAGGYRQY